VVVDVAQQQAVGRLVHDEPDIAAHAHRPEVSIARLVELVKAHARAGRVHLQVERRRLGGLLLVAGQAREAGGEGVGDAEVHGRAPSLWITG